MLIWGWLAIMGLLGSTFNNWLGGEQNPNRQHHCLVSGSTNGEPATFPLDTGATDVVIPARPGLAEKSGLKKGYSRSVTTASGRNYGLLYHFG